MAGKFSQISIRITPKMDDHINELIRRGEYASKSDYGYQALLEFMKKEERQAIIRQELVDLIISDTIVASALKRGLRDVLASFAITPDPNIKKKSPEDVIKTPGTDDP